jgi:hypothetical protein
MGGHDKKEAHGSAMSRSVSLMMRFGSAMADICEKSKRISSNEVATKTTSPDME